MDPSPSKIDKFYEILFWNQLITKYNTTGTVKFVKAF